MRKVYPLLFILLVAILAACGSQSTTEQGSGNSEEQTDEVELHPVEVNILSTGEDFNPSEEGMIEVRVTQGSETVDDADEVLLEIWQGNDKHESVNYEAENRGDGLYTLAHTFPEDGIYYVIAHVTARDMHVMPRKEFIIGEVDLANEADEHDHHNHSHHNHGHHDHSHHDHGHGVSIHLIEPDILREEEQALWVVHLAEEDGRPLAEATVRFDYWQDGQVHTLIDAVETVAGEYTAEFSFPEAGEYRLVVHVENEELHEHLETRVLVE